MPTEFSSASLYWSLSPFSTCSTGSSLCPRKGASTVFTVVWRRSVCSLLLVYQTLEMFVWSRYGNDFTFYFLVFVSGKEAVDSWYSEIKDYNWSSPGFSGQTGECWRHVRETNDTQTGCKVKKLQNYKPCDPFKQDCYRSYHTSILWSTINTRCCHYGND